MNLPYNFADFVINLKSLQKISDSLARYFIKNHQELDQFIQLEILDLLSSNSEINISDLWKLRSQVNRLHQAFLDRIILVAIVVEARRKLRNFSREETDFVWKLIYNSTVTIAGNTIGSIGSQGFLVIPLFRYEEKGVVQILRLHIWCRKIDEMVNLIDNHSFSIHSHLYFGQSWILQGNLVDERFSIIETSEPSVTSKFKIDWDSTTHNSTDFNRKSHLVNTGKHVQVIQKWNQVYNSEEMYTIDAGEFHRSTRPPSTEMSATLFLFDSMEGQAEKSFVLGPSKDIHGPNHNYNSLDSYPLLNTINKIFQNELE